MVVSEDEDMAAMEAKIREQWFGRGASSSASPGSSPLPAGSGTRVVIEVATHRVWDSSAQDVETVLYRRTLGGSRVEIKRTRDAEEAKAEVERWRAAGATVEPFRQWR